MVYEGRRGTYRKKTKKKGRGFKVCLWVLVIVTAAAFLFPKTAGRVRDSVAGFIGVDLGGAVRAFNQEMRDGSGVLAAAKGAFQYAFRQDPGQDIQASAGESGAGGGAGEGEAAPVSKELTPVELFKASQEGFGDLPLPNNVTYELTRPGLALTEPVPGSVSLGFGYRESGGEEARFHYGLDIAAAGGASVGSAAPGQVAAVGESTVYGKYVIVSHDDGIQSLYAGLGDTALSGGETVDVGQCLGHLDDSGKLHLELVVDGDYVNPQYYLYEP